MKSSIISAAAILATTASAAPALVKRQSSDIDGVILNYALTLEHLEANFYATGIAKFSEQDFTNAGFNGSNFYRDLKEVGRDEQVHVDFLTTALKGAGVTPVAACTYDFGNLTPASFIATAQVLEGVGVSAYLGAAALITNKAYLTAAGSILTVEARHSSFVRNSLALVPSPQPFDIPLDFNQVYSLAAPFIKSCPSTNPPLPVKAFPALTVGKSVTGPVAQGDTIEFDIPAGMAVPAGPLYVAFPLADGTMYSSAVVKDCKVYARVPVGHTGPNGEVYAILTTSATAISDDNTVAGPAVLEVKAPFVPASASS
ncbi:Ferritin/ribonucleotide reductase [Aureobasidium subglaciale]|nr:Ferritin/ribonucleotide reductase [Aureobasidium subglaciale]